MKTFGLRPPPSVLIVLIFAARSTTAQNNCASFEAVFDHCLEFGVGGATTSCKPCVTNLFPTLVNACARIRSGFCDAYESCSCGSCETQARAYFNCLVDDCDLTPCGVTPTATPVQQQLPDTPVCQGNAITDCGAAFNPVQCSSCDTDFCLDIRDNYCGVACQHPGCGCTIDFGQCNLFNPNFPSTQNTVRCSGSPFRCNEIVTQSSCSNAIGCTWVEGVAAPTPPPIPQIEEEGVCVGAGIATCDTIFSPLTCSSCDAASCIAPANVCQANCDHPGCSCRVDTGVCSLYAQFGTNPTVISCAGTPIRCSSLTNEAACSRGTNCLWIPSGAVPTPTPEIAPEGICRGTAVSQCASQYSTLTYNSCDNVPFTEYRNCIADCVHPGCECHVNRGVCGLSSSTLSCSGTPRPCNLISSQEECDRAGGCFWEEQQQAEPTFSPVQAPAPAPTPTTPCRTDVGLQCTMESGAPCSTASAPSNTKCAVGNPLFSLQFEYTANGCNGHANQQGNRAACSDVGSLSSAAQVDITCVQSNNNAVVLDVNPSRVVPGEYFTISNPRAGALPSSISCAISNPNVSGASGVLQAVTFDASGSFELDLKDGFGSLQLIRCDSNTCLDRFRYRTTVTNLDTRNLQITQLNLDFTSGGTVNLLQTVNPRVLGPGAVGTADHTRTVDLCEATNLGATARVSASSTSSISTCSDSTQLSIPIVPRCGLDLTQTCRGFGDAAGPLRGRNCQQIPGESSTSCSCPSGCARELRFRYIAQPCGASTTGFTCRDVTGVLPQDAARIVIQRSDSAVTLYENARVPRGEEIMFSSNNACLPASFTIQIMTVGTSQVMQTLTIAPNCGPGSPGIRLLGPYGAVRFTGYTCNANNVHNCFVDIEHNACAENDGTDTRTLATFDLEFNNSIFNLLQGTSQADRTLPAGGSFCNQVVTQLPLCRSGTYRAVASARSDPRCSDADLVFSEINFSIFPGSTPVPTLQIEPEPTVPPPTPRPPTPRPPTPPAPTPRPPTPPAPTQDCSQIRPVFAPPCP